MSLLSWEQYSSLHSIVSSEAEFDVAVQLAEKDIRNVIGILKWLDANINAKEEIYYDQLLDCICNVINYNATITNKVGNGIASASNDGYSETYILQKKSDAQAELAKNIKLWLSGTGLVGAY